MTLWQKNLLGIFLILLIVCGYFWREPAMRFLNPNRAPIKVGVLHSLTGTMAISERAVVDATLLAIEEINKAGGLLGRQIQPVVVDGQSQWDVFAKEAERLTVEEKVSVVFGCWTSASRKTVVPVFEKYNHLLFYPVQYEGMESSRNVVYTGAAPNQQIIPAVKWSIDRFGKKVFLVASDYIFPRAANEIIKDQLDALDAKIVGEEYILLGSRDVEGAVSAILKEQPDVIFNTINGDTNTAFFTRLREAGITSDKIPVMSFSISENELSQIDPRLMIGDYAAWNYFQTIDTPANKNFVANFREKYGTTRVINDPMEAAYIGVYLWAQAVKEAGMDDPKEARKFIANQSFLAPEGVVYLDSDNQHTWKIVRIGQVNASGQFDILWSSEKPVRPQPYPVSRSSFEWNEMLDSLYEVWDKNWANLSAQDFNERVVGPYIEIIQAFSRDPAIMAAIETANQEHQTLDQDEIERLDKKWRGADEQDPFIIGFAFNEASKALRRFQGEHPQFREIFVTDKHGLNAAITNKISDYYQADESWWQKTFSNKEGPVIMEPMEYDRSARAWVIPFYLPIANAESEIVGVMKALLAPRATDD